MRAATIASAFWLALMPLTSTSFAQSTVGGLVSGGKCLDIHFPDLNINGGRTQVWDCWNGPNQRWRFIPDGGRTAGRVVNEAGKCLDVHLPDMARNGARVQIWDCLGGENQKWHLDTAGRLHNAEGRFGKCLDVHSPDVAMNGARVQIWDCHGGSNQKWAFPAQPSGGWCGDFFGDLPCAAGTTCRRRSSGQIETIDKFCQAP